MLRLRISGAIHPLTLYTFLEWTGTTLSLPHRYNIVSVLSYKHVLDIKIHHLKETVTERKLILVKVEKNNIKMDVKNEGLW
jgi:hypothetical protein